MLYCLSYAALLHCNLWCTTLLTVCMVHYYCCTVLCTTALCMVQYNLLCGALLLCTAIVLNCPCGGTAVLKMWCAAILYGALLYCVMHRFTLYGKILQYCVVHYCEWCIACAVCCYTMWRTATMYSVAGCWTVWCTTVVLCMVQYCC